MPYTWRCLFPDAWLHHAAYAAEIADNAFDSAQPNNRTASFSARDTYAGQGGSDVSGKRIFVFYPTDRTRTSEVRNNQDKI